MEKVYMVKDSYDKLKSELEYLKTDKRMEIQAAIGTARAHGDLRENAEYDAAREAQGLLEAKIRKLEDELARAEIVDSSKIPKDTICFGAKVELEDLETGDIENYQLVGAGDDDPMNGKILVSSPVAKALLGGKIDEILEVDVPVGKLRYKVLRIEY
ncbi:MAG: transcription elongation factor GreA [Candidatus Scalindua sp.]|nr:MAG: transcription elongation factor GreA [Candidatus Scalindua sp.]